MTARTRYSYYATVLFQALVLMMSVTSMVAAGEEGSATQSVGKLRAAADLHFSKGEIDKSLQMWEKVIQMEPENDSNYYKRFRVYLRQHKFKEALSDLNSALNLKPANEQALVQRGKLQLRLGKCTEAEADFKKLKSVSPSNKDLSFMEPAAICAQAARQADVKFNQKSWVEAKELYSTALQHAENAAGLYLKKAWCEYRMGDMYESIADTGKVLKLEGDNIEALELRGGSYYTLGEFDAAMNHYRQGLKFDPEHPGCKSGHRLVKKVTQSQQKAAAALEKKDFDAAVKHLRTLLETDPQHSVVAPKAHVDLAIALKSMGKLKEAKQEVEKAIAMNEQNADAYKVLGNIHSDLEEYDEAVGRLRRANEIRPDDRELQDELRRAEAAQKQSKQKDYYKILGVARKANKKEIKRAYRELALQWHPDKHTGEEEKIKAQTQFQLISEAYEVLEDDEKRAKYDRGEDVFPNQGGGQPQHNPFGHFGHGNPFGGHQFHFNFG